jgi:DNA-binding MarR family transcriptional regulator
MHPLSDGAEIDDEQVGEAEITVEAAWALFLRAHSLAGRRIEAELVRRHDLPMASFEVMRALDDQPGRRLRMAELAGRVALSRSGVSRVVDRLERQGLVHRQTCDADLRGTYAALTYAGREQLAMAGATHAASVGAYVGQALGADGARRLAEALEPLVTALSASPPATRPAQRPGRGRR